MGRKEDGFGLEQQSSIVIYGVDLEDGQWFQKQLKNYKGNAGKRLFKEMIFRYESDMKFALMYKELEELKERLERLEDVDKKEKVKTFRGEK